MNIETSKHYPFNIEIDGKFFQDLETFEAIIMNKTLKLLLEENASMYLGIGLPTISDSSPEGKQQIALFDAIRTVIKKELDPIKNEYSRLYNLCLDYIAGDVSGQIFKKELRTVLQVSEEEAELLDGKKRFKK